ncbi:hypothetical protein C9374_003325 [Naegleria lovaniensis]|uniref:F-box domain-containing protein n=1 Tax=Naegleria lovaniensis TaxID=51637 RepID=A0AA88KJD1_NAELO|nr:uncharacterized protein C9374_003325 [Naegleria lovaniensis]KAG2385510.1 hypothetical protein C9374_003325 [Naegleria lovaniensis]
MIILDLDMDCLSILSRFLSLNDLYHFALTHSVFDQVVVDMENCSIFWLEKYRGFLRDKIDEYEWAIGESMDMENDLLDHNYYYSHIGYLHRARRPVIPSLFYKSLQHRVLRIKEKLEHLQEEYFYEGCQLRYERFTRDSMKNVVAYEFYDISNKLLNYISENLIFPHSMIQVKKFWLFPSIESPTNTHVFNIRTVLSQVEYSVVFVIEKFHLFCTNPTFQHHLKRLMRERGVFQFMAFISRSDLLDLNQSINWDVLHDRYSSFMKYFEPNGVGVKHFPHQTSYHLSKLRNQYGTFLMKKGLTRENNNNIAVKENTL